MSPRGAAAARVALAVWGAGCHGPRVLPPPSDGAARAALAITERAGAYAAALDDAWSIDIPSGDAGAIELLLYAAPLEDLALTEGAFTADTAGPCARLAPTSAWRAGPDDARFSASALTEATAERVLVGGWARCGRCATFEEQRLTLPGTHRLWGAALAADGDSLLGSHPLAGLLAIDRDRADPVSGCPGDTSFGGWVPRGGDRYWVGDGRGAVLEVSVRSGRCAVLAAHATTSTRALRWVAGDPERDEVVAVDATGGIHWGAGAGPLTEVATLPISPGRTLAEGTNIGGAAWISPGVFAVSAGAPEIAWIVDGQLARRDRLPPTTDLDGVSALTHADGAALVGDALGRVFRAALDGGLTASWEDRRAAGAAIGDVLPDRDGFFITSEWGYVNAWYPSAGWCTPHEIQGATARPRASLLTPRGLVLTDIVGDVSRPGQVVWLDAR